MCHRDLKLENTLLDGRPAPRLKICDFGYSKSAVFDSQPKSTVGTPAYIAPEACTTQPPPVLSAPCCLSRRRPAVWKGNPSAEWKITLCCGLHVAPDM